MEAKKKSLDSLTFEKDSFTHCSRVSNSSCDCTVSVIEPAE